MALTSVPTKVSLPPMDWQVLPVVHDELQRQRPDVLAGAARTRGDGRDVAKLPLEADEGVPQPVQRLRQHPLAEPEDGVPLDLADADVLPQAADQALE